MSRLERIVAACGGILLDGGSRALIPGPDHSRKDRSVSLRETDDGRILIHCFSPKDDWRAVRRALAEKGLLNKDAQPASGGRRLTPHCVASQPESEDRVRRAQRIWEESRPLRWTAATIYLRARAIPASHWESAALRFHPAMTSLDDRKRRPALVAAISDAAGQVQGVQVTLLTKHGAAKAPLPTPRRVIGRLLAGAVRLGSHDDTLLIAEGIESALSASAALSIPAWALLSAHNVSLFAPPEGLAHLVIAADNDAAGNRAHAILYERLHRKLVLTTALPPHEAGDWNEAACTAIV
jgi:putative DNA primase/helicase